MERPELIEVDGSFYKEAYSGLTFIVSSLFFMATPDEREATFNGMGPNWFPSWLRKLLLRIYGLSVKFAAVAHDFEYTYHPDFDYEYKKMVDDALYHNAMQIINAKSGNRFTRFLRKTRARIFRKFLNTSFSKKSYDKL